MLWAGLTETCFREVSLLAYSPLAFGRLTGKYVDDAQAKGRLTTPATWSPRYAPRSDRYQRPLHKLARDYGYTDAIGTGMVLLAMVRHQHHYRRYKSATIGRKTFRATDVKLTEEVIAAINAIHAVASNPAQ